jgi:hypothetical protein
MRKLLLNCDQVFDVLTRGPFPSGDETDQPVESHLRACHECRQLAEALQPAVYLLHESLSAQDCEELPRYQGVWSAIDKQREELRDFRTDGPSRNVPRAAHAPSPRSAQHLEASFILRTLASVLLLVTVVVASWSLITTLSVTRLHPVAAADGEASGRRTAAPEINPAGLVLLASLDLPSTCFPGEWSAGFDSARLDSAGLDSAGQSLPANSDLRGAGVRCCTECHHAAAKQARQRDEAASRDPDVRLVAVVKESCAACHTPPAQAL